MHPEAEVPPLVRRAQALARANGFAASCTNDVGHLLRELAGRVSSGIVAEFGSGFGVGSAWLACGLRPGVRLVTAELDRERASGVEGLLAGRDVTVLAGDWRMLTELGPFALLFADGGNGKDADLYPLVRPGGIVVLDDLTDPRDWDAELRAAGDALRDRWLCDARYAVSLVAVGADKRDPTRRAQALVAERR